jgi:hypothetical protein
MFAAGLPMLLHGQEFMEDRAFGDTTAHRIQWPYKTNYADYFLACRDMTWLRRRSTALRGDADQNIFHVNEAGNVVAWHRWNQSGDDLIIVASFNNSVFDSYCVGLPLGGDWLELFNSDAAIYGGDNRGNGGRITANGPARDGLPTSACLTLPRMGVLVLGRRPVNLTPVDADLDGIPDAWESSYGFNPASNSDRNTDADGDGMKNWEEYVAGTDLTSATSYLKVENVWSGMTSNQQLRLEFNAVSNKTYTVLSRDSLTAGVWNRLADVVANSLDRVVQIPDQRPSNSPPRFYRLVTPRAP